MDQKPPLPKAFTSYIQKNETQKASQKKVQDLVFNGYYIKHILENDFRSDHFLITYQSLKYASALIPPSPPIIN